nr:putative ribonuclease H-like domain-containing protein [Tanacetum cinerariifolium]
DLEAFSDSDYAGAHGDRKSTTGGCQFIGRRLISWHCKKQTIVATSSCKAEYVAAASCCGQVCFDCNPTIYASVVRQFWGSASEVSLPDGVKGLVATIDGTVYTVTEASIRSVLQLDDINAIDTMSNAKNVAGLRDIRETCFCTSSTTRGFSTPPSPVVTPHPSPDPMPSPPRVDSAGRVVSAGRVDSASELDSAGRVDSA